MVEGDLRHPTRSNSPVTPVGALGSPVRKAQLWANTLQWETQAQREERRASGHLSCSRKSPHPAPAAGVWGAPGSQDAAPRSAALRPAPPPKVAECGSVPQSRGFQHQESTLIQLWRPRCGQGWSPLWGTVCPGLLLEPLGMDTRRTHCCPVFPAPCVPNLPLLPVPLLSSS